MHDLHSIPTNIPTLNTYTRRPGEVLIKVAAAGVNPIDFKTRGAQGGVPRWAVTLPKVSTASAAASCSARVSYFSSKLCLNVLPGLRVKIENGSL
jgi:hypothetical protein